MISNRLARWNTVVGYDFQSNAVVTATEQEHLKWVFRRNIEPNGCTYLIPAYYVQRKNYVEKEKENVVRKSI